MADCRRKVETQIACHGQSQYECGLLHHRRNNSSSARDKSRRAADPWRLCRASTQGRACEKGVGAWSRLLAVHQDLAVIIQRTPGLAPALLDQVD